MVVPIKFGTLNLQRSTEVGVITATPRPEGPPMHPEEGKKEEIRGGEGREEERREEKRKGKESRGEEKMSSSRVAPGSLPGGAAQ